MNINSERYDAAASVCLNNTLSGAPLISRTRVSMYVCLSFSRGAGLSGDIVIVYGLAWHGSCCIYSMGKRKKIKI